MLIDSHAHLDFDDYEGDLDGVIQRARDAGLCRIVLIGLWRSPGAFGNALELAAREPDLFAATIGIHAHDCARVPAREADEACARVLAEEGVPQAGGVIHCFTGDWARARAYLDLGLYLSVAGVVTFRTAGDLREAVRQVPRDRLLVETDCPFLAPIPHRGKRNEPAFVARTAEQVAELWGVSV